MSKSLRNVEEGIRMGEGPELVPDADCNAL
jgi:hypothetical protein